MTRNSRGNYAEITQRLRDTGTKFACEPLSRGMDECEKAGQLMLDAAALLDQSLQAAANTIRALLAQAAPPAAPVQDTGVTLAADFIQRKADDYAREFGSDDMGSLSFGNDAMRDYHWGLLELADEIRALAAPAAPASEQECNCNACYSSRMVRGTADPANCEAPSTGESGAEKLDRLERVLDGYEDMPDATPPATEAASAQQDGIDADWVLGYFDADAPQSVRDSVHNAFAEYAALNVMRDKQQVQAGGADKRYRIGAAWKRGGSAGYTRTSLPENARDGQYQLWAELIQPFAALSREQPQPSNGDREGGA